jgi:dihydrofolate reductase
VRKVVVYELLSLDGVPQDPDSSITVWDEAMDANLPAVIAAQDAVILGHRSYGEWSELWPDSDIQSFAKFINEVAKYVGAATPLQREWAHPTEIDGDLAEVVRDLKAQPGGDIGVHARKPANTVTPAQPKLKVGCTSAVRTAATTKSPAR